MLLTVEIEKLQTEKTRFMACFKAFGYDGDFREACRIQDEIDKLESLAPGPQVQTLEKLNED